MTADMTLPTFHDQIISILPKLRIQALALTRNRAAAEDLVQDAVCNALSAQQSFIPGTNFPAWMHRILRNRFISNLRKRRDTTDIDDVPSSVFATEAPHEDRLALKGVGTGDDASAIGSARSTGYGCRARHELRGAG